MATKTQKHVHQGWRGFAVYRMTGDGDWFQTEAIGSNLTAIAEARSDYRKRFPQTHFEIFDVCQSGPKGDTYSYRCGGEAIF